MKKLLPDSNGWYCGHYNGFSLGVNYLLRTELYANEALHYHKDFSEFYLVISGYLVLEVSGVKYKVSASEMVVVEPNEEHQVVEVNNCAYVVIKEKSYVGNKIIIQPTPQ
ncbi:cupin domain-containing protein [Candidatus Woesearchaeota archaeon]|nr:cupin domain-containing protein [Candidatus Woesearchaeota archaeon]